MAGSVHNAYLFSVHRISERGCLTVAVHSSISGGALKKHPGAKAAGLYSGSHNGEAAVVRVPRLEEEAMGREPATEAVQLS